MVDYCQGFFGIPLLNTHPFVFSLEDGHYLGQHHHIIIRYVSVEPLHLRCAAPLHFTLVYVALIGYLERTDVGRVHQQQETLDTSGGSPIIGVVSRQPG